MPCRKTSVLCSLCLAGAGSALLLGLLAGFAPRGVGYEMRRGASSRILSLEACDLPAPIVEAGDGSHVWAIRRPVSPLGEMAAPDTAAPNAAVPNMASLDAAASDTASQGAALAAGAPHAATLAAASAVSQALALRREGEFVSFDHEGIRLALSPADSPLALEDSPRPGAKAGHEGLRLQPLLPLDGAAAPHLVAVGPFRAAEALDMDGRPLRWRENPGLVAACRPLPHALPARPEKAAQTSRPLPSPAYAAGDVTERARRYRTLVESFAARYNLSPALVYAIIHSESDFSPSLVSAKSAMGLMQLLPSTASGEVHRFLYGRRGDVGFDDLRVPEINIRYGTAYLHILLTRYFQNVEDPLSREYCAVAAYNMGPNRFLRLYGQTGEEAVARINAMTAEELFEDLTRRLPVRETRAYVAKVHRMKSHYAARLATTATN